jgi:hypothetical protein
MRYGPFDIIKKVSPNAFNGIIFKNGVVIIQTILGYAFNGRIFIKYT